MTNEDRVFFRNFLVVLAVLIVIALLVGVFAGGMSSADRAESGLDPRYAETVAERIKPVGQIAVGEPPQEEKAAANAASAQPRTGEEVYNTAGCSGCHGGAMPNAPAKGDTAAWQSRWDAGIDATLENAIAGMGGGAMPARGGSDATDDELRNTIIYLFKEAGFE